MSSTSKPNEGEGEAEIWYNAVNYVQIGDEMCLQIEDNSNIPQNADNEDNTTDTNETEEMESKKTENSLHESEGYCSMISSRQYMGSQISNISSVDGRDHCLYRSTDIDNSVNICDNNENYDLLYNRCNSIVGSPYRKESALIEVMRHGSIIQPRHLDRRSFKWFIFGFFTVAITCFCTVFIMYIMKNETSIMDIFKKKKIVCYFRQFDCPPMGNS